MIVFGTTPQNSSLVHPDACNSGPERTLDQCILKEKVALELYQYLTSLPLRPTLLDQHKALYVNQRSVVLCRHRLFLPYL